MFGSKTITPATEKQRLFSELTKKKINLEGPIQDLKEYFKNLGITNNLTIIKNIENNFDELKKLCKDVKDFLPKYKNLLKYLENLKKENPTNINKESEIKGNIQKTEAELNIYKKKINELINIITVIDFFFFDLMKNLLNTSSGVSEQIQRYNNFDEINKVLNDMVQYYLLDISERYMYINELISEVEFENLKSLFNENSLPKDIQLYSYKILVFSIYTGANVQSILTNLAKVDITDEKLKEEIRDEIVCTERSTGIPPNEQTEDKEKVKEKVIKHLEIGVFKEQIKIYKDNKNNDGELLKLLTGQKFQNKQTIIAMQQKKNEANLEKMHGFFNKLLEDRSTTNDIGDGDDVQDGGSLLNMFRTTTQQKKRLEGLLRSERQSQGLASSSVSILNPSKYGTFNYMRNYFNQTKSPSNISNKQKQHELYKQRNREERLNKLKQKIDNPNPYMKFKQSIGWENKPSSYTPPAASASSPASSSSSSITSIFSSFRPSMPTMKIKNPLSKTNEQKKINEVLSKSKNLGITAKKTGVFVRTINKITITGDTLIQKLGLKFKDNKNEGFNEKVSDINDLINSLVPISKEIKEKEGQTSELLRLNKLKNDIIDKIDYKFYELMKYCLDNENASYIDQLNNFDSFDELEEVLNGYLNQIVLSLEGYQDYLVSYKLLIYKIFALSNILKITNSIIPSAFKKDVFRIDFGELYGKITDRYFENQFKKLHNKSWNESSEGNEKELIIKKNEYFNNLINYMSAKVLKGKIDKYKTLTENTKNEGVKTLYLNITGINIRSSPSAVTVASDPYENFNGKITTVLSRLSKDKTNKIINLAAAKKISKLREKITNSLLKVVTGKPNKEQKLSEILNKVSTLKPTDSNLNNKIGNIETLISTLNTSTKSDQENSLKAQIARLIVELKKLEGKIFESNNEAKKREIATALAKTTNYNNGNKTLEELNKILAELKTEYQKIKNYQVNERATTAALSAAENKARTAELQAKRSEITDLKDEIVAMKDEFVEGESKDKIIAVENDNTITNGNSSALAQKISELSNLIHLLQEALKEQNKYINYAKLVYNIVKSRINAAYNINWNTNNSVTGSTQFINDKYFKSRTPEQKTNLITFVNTCIPLIKSLKVLLEIPIKNVTADQFTEIKKKSTELIKEYAAHLIKIADEAKQHHDENFKTYATGTVQPFLIGNTGDEYTTDQFAELIGKLKELSSKLKSRAGTAVTVETHHRPLMHTIGDLQNLSNINSKTITLMTGGSKSRKSSKKSKTKSKSSKKSKTKSKSTKKSKTKKSTKSKSRNH